jgi:hypothetical protein
MSTDNHIIALRYTVALVINIMLTQWLGLRTNWAILATLSMTNVSSYNLKLLISEANSMTKYTLMGSLLGILITLLIPFQSNNPILNIITLLISSVVVYAILSRGSYLFFIQIIFASLMNLLGQSYTLLEPLYISLSIIIAIFNTILLNWLLNPTNIYVKILIEIDETYEECQKIIHSIQENSPNMNPYITINLKNKIEQLNNTLQDVTIQLNEKQKNNIKEFLDTAIELSFFYNSCSSLITSTKLKRLSKKSFLSFYDRKIRYFLINLDSQRKDCINFYKFI